MKKIIAMLKMLIWRVNQFGWATVGVDIDAVKNAKTKTTAQ